MKMTNFIQRQRNIYIDDEQLKALLRYTATVKNSCWYIAFCLIFYHYPGAHYWRSLLVQGNNILELHSVIVPLNMVV